MSGPLRTGLLYDAVALGMTAYVSAKYDATLVGGERLRLEPGRLLVSTHRSDDDVPVICSLLYREARVYRRGVTRPGFAVRDDLFQPGFFAGFPPRLPALLRRLLWPVAIGEILRSRLGCLPIRSATRMNLAEALADVPDLPLERLPPAAAEALRRRARALRRPEPRVVADVLAGEYARELWQSYDRAELAAPELEAAWARRAVEAAGDFRRLVEVVREGASLLLFPEGRPSPDGTIGPLRPGLVRLVRRGRPTGLQPLALAYDPLAGARGRVVLAIGHPVEPPFPDALEDAVLRELRRTTPLLAGHAVASLAGRLGRVPAAGEAVDAVERAVEDARRAGRPLDPVLAEGAAPAADRALRRLVRLGTGHPFVRRLAATHESAGAAA